MTPEKHPPLELVSVADNRPPAGAGPRSTVAVIPGHAECIELYFEVAAELLRQF